VTSWSASHPNGGLRIKELLWWWRVRIALTDALVPGREHAGRNQRVGHFQELRAIDVAVEGVPAGVWAVSATNIKFCQRTYDAA
jgi:hypothetical protein